ncbi:MAG: Rrf2 family transcriptional regulator [Streptococcus parasanguinis]|nr:Rrf2 family transcriptional regulator [Streptococcus parasanguinis]
MQISSRFTIGTHVLIMIALQGEKTKVTSDFLAGSVGVNPVIIRKTLSQLKKAGLIHVARGTGGAELAKAADEISLLDIYQAVECLGSTGQLFGFHDNPNPACPIGHNIFVRIRFRRPTSAQLSRAVKADEISVVEPTQPLRIARQSKDN